MWNRKMLVLGLSMGAGFMVAPVGATVVNFNSDSWGVKPNGFVSVDSSLVSFTDSIGANLVTQALPESNNSIALIVLQDDPSKLLMDFTTPVSSLSLDFGNDDPGYITTAGYAVMRAFNGATLVGETDVHVNANDLMDQTISLSGVGNFNHAEFFYADASKNPTNLSEVVDNVTFTAIPEPTLLGMLMPLGLMLRRRRKD